MAENERPCSKCRREIGTVPTVYGPYCEGCFERWSDDLAEATQRIREQRLAYLRGLSEMGERFEDRTFENYRRNLQNRIAYGAAREAWENGGGLYLYGRPGNGKTHLAAAIVNAAIAAGTEAIFITGVGLLQRIREVYKRGHAETERGILAHYAKVPILALDDLGTEPFTQDTGRLFYALINSRYEHRHKPLIVTSNLSLADLVRKWRESGVEAHVGDKIADRIRELCSNRIVQIEAPSERGNVA